MKGKEEKIEVEMVGVAEKIQGNFKREEIK
jgi:hypothetical protein